MSTIFLGGSRHISTVPVEIQERLDNIIKNQYQIIVGDSNGVDKLIQNYLYKSGYQNVNIFCSGTRCRNNIGHWKIESIQVPSCVSGFQFYAVKDREMAKKANYGLMIWDGKSPGTILNILRLIRSNKISVLYNTRDGLTQNFRNINDWLNFLYKCDIKLIRDLQKRATKEEWIPFHPTQKSIFDEETVLSTFSTRRSRSTKALPGLPGA